MPDNYIYERIKAMYEKFDLLHPVVTDRDKHVRICMLQEELNEYHEACTETDEADALVDLLVFTIGTMIVHGYPLLPIFDVVMDANEAKVFGDKGRGTSRDLVKPDGWVGPEVRIWEILTGDSPMYDDNVIKDDSGKTRLELLPFATLTGVADVFAYGADKYYQDSWRSAKPAVYSRSFGSVLRHLTKWYAGEDIDPESGLNHVDHAISQLLILRYSMLNNAGECDDRFKESADAELPQ
jgi:hypothetical protein